VRETPWRLLAAALVGIALAGCGGSKISVSDGPTKGAPAVGRPLAHDFVLRDQADRSVRLSEERGRWVFLTFLYTHCPNECPLTAERLNSVLTRLGSRRDEVRVLAVSVDPKGDTPTAVRAFIKSHHLLPQFRYLTGTRAELERTWVSYNVVSRLGAKELFHTSLTVLVDPSGHVRMYYSPASEAAEWGDLENLLGRARS